MILRPWDELPEELQLPEVKEYYDLLAGKKGSLVCKRVFDVAASSVLLVLLSPVFLGLGAVIKLDSAGPVFYRQTRVTRYGKEFRIHKFRTMCDDADKKGTLVTVADDARITRVGRLIRDKHLDEIAQLIDVLQGTMTFVGVRPEVPEYVAKYSPEMTATLLLPAGVTNLACLYYSNEAKLLNAAEDPDAEYTEQILPEKMKWNLKCMKEFSLRNDLKMLFMTFLAMCGKEYSAE